MLYRKDVQMLRGVAVLLVVMFHLGVEGFASGFLGVDVFFVISGFLMAVMYDPREKSVFFERRAKRLLPAYFATVVATLLAALLLTVPNDFRQVARQGEWATVFASNVGFWWENAYFDKAAFRPLLHLWSLGVEIQFYVLVPLVYWILRKTRAAGFAVMTLGSLAACFWMVGVSTNTAFFWLPFRLWEFLMGFGLATWRPRPMAATTAWMGTVGLAAIALIPFVPVSGDAPNFVLGHPGLAALGITTATAAVLMYGLPGRLMGTAAAAWLERLGDCSYSVYLAHFPVIVLMLYQPFSGTVLKTEGAMQVLVLLILVAAFSAALYGLVERPLRHKPLRLPPVAAAVACVIFLALVGPMLQKLPLSPKERAINAAWEDRDGDRCGKLARVLHPTARTCELTGLAQPSSKILLVGNSHADSIKKTFAEAAAARNMAVYFLVDNSPLMKGGMGPAAIVDEATALGATALVIHHSPGSVTAERIAETAALAKQRGIRTSVILPVPVRKDNVPHDLWLEVRGGVSFRHGTAEEYRRLNAPLLQGLAAVNLPDFRVYPVAQVFCAETCEVQAADGTPYYFDDQHLTLTGSARLRGLFDTVVQDLGKPSAR
jgi:peptidoglycan/LPS O-acetylase OafA/YrhL